MFRGIYLCVGMALTNLMCTESLAVYRSGGVQHFLSVSNIANFRHEAGQNIVTFFIQ